MKSHTSALPPDRRRRQHRDAQEYALRRRIGTEGRELFLANGLMRTARAALRSAIEGPESTDPAKSKLLRAVAFSCIVRAKEALQRAEDAVPLADRVEQVRLAAELDATETEFEERDAGLTEALIVRVAGITLRDSGTGVEEVGDVCAN